MVKPTKRVFTINNLQFIFGNTDEAKIMGIWWYGPPLVECSLSLSLSIFHSRHHFQDQDKYEIYEFSRFRSSFHKYMVSLTSAFALYFHGKLANQICFSYMNVCWRRWHGVVCTTHMVLNRWTKAWCTHHASQLMRCSLSMHQEMKIDVGCSLAWATDPN